MPGSATAPRPAWQRWFAVGLVLWIASAVVAYWTENANLLPTIILLGSFLVPTTFVLWVLETKASHVLAPTLVLKAFIVGGVLGVLLASLLESRFITGDRPIGVSLGVAVIEELVKLVALWWVARGVTATLRPTRRDGMVLGAAVGFGFAAFETAGYAFNTVVTVAGYDLRALLEVEVLRGLLSPVGHGLWTAVLGGALFASARTTGRFRIDAGVVRAYVVVVALHALWDMAGGIAAVLAYALTAEAWQLALLEQGRIPAPTQEQVHLAGALTWLLLLVVAVGGVVVLRRAWERALREEGIA